MWINTLADMNMVWISFEFFMMWSIIPPFYQFSIFSLPMILIFKTMGEAINMLSISVTNSVKSIYIVSTDEASLIFFLYFSSFALISINSRSNIFLTPNSITRSLCSSHPFRSLCIPSEHFVINMRILAPKNFYVVIQISQVLKR